MRRWAVLLVLVLSRPLAAQPVPEPPAAPTPAPAWVAGVAGVDVGSVLNAGRMECHRTELTLQDGKLVGHYWIDDRDPFEGTLTGFVADSGTSGHFTWSDRYGTGVEALVFSSDHQSFSGTWGGDQPDPENVVWAARGGACQVPAIS